jgi:hypothetical protein
MSDKTIRVRPDGSTEEDATPDSGGIKWPEQTVAPVKPMNSRRPTLSEIRDCNGRTEPYGA